MVGRDITPTEIGKHAKLIKVAQDEMAVMDVLVCGRCLTVFHFIEEFEQHKNKLCFKENNNVRECNDTKPKIWAFLLWKATQLNNNKDDSTTAAPTSWALYQTWVKMDESLRETWIVAGKTIQSFAKVSQGSLQEMPVKITKTVVNNSLTDGVSTARKPLASNKPVANIKSPIKLPVINKASNETECETTTNKSPLGNNTLQKIFKKPVTSTPLQNTKVISSNNSNAVSNKLLTRRAKRSIPNSEEYVEENVEKIVAKRFNPRRRMHEYLVKWESQALQNTWEPASHLENVPHLLETFEKQLARQKETRAALQAKQQQQQQQQQTSDSSKSQMVSPTSMDRPQRTSKTKAMDQVKQWVTDASNSIANSPDSDTGHSNELEKDWSSGSLGIKRKLDESEYNDSNNTDSHTATTTSTTEDLEEDLIPSHTLKRMKYGNAVSVEVKTKQDNTKHIKLNGTTSVRSDLSNSSAEVIITQDSKASGVVKKPGFNSSAMTQKTEAQIRVLSKGESAINNSGIVRINNNNETSTATSIISVATTQVNNQTQPKSQLSNRTQQIRAGNAIVSGNKHKIGTTNQVRQVVQQVVRTPGGTTIQRKTMLPANSSSQTSTAQRTTGVQNFRTTTQSTQSPSRTAVSRQGQINSVNTVRQQQKAVTPEQKILQLSKSGDLKVTKKVMTREDIMAQRATQQQQQRQQQARQQSQIHIQKVQQLSGPAQKQNNTTVTRKSGPITVQQNVLEQPEEEHQAQLCPITGNIITPGGTISNPEEQIDMQSQLTEQQHLNIQQQQEHRQQLQESLDGNILIAQDQMLTNEDGSPLLVTGEDGTVYQVAGKNAEGQTILVTQGADGEQQFAYVAESDHENQVLTLDNAVAEAVAQLPAEQQVEALAAVTASEMDGGQYLVKTTQEDGTTQMVTMTAEELAQHQALVAAQQQQQSDVQATSQLCIQTGDGTDDQETNIPAEVVRAELPSPGGTRRVVLLLQDGTFMMTEMHDDEFKALNITL